MSLRACLLSEGGKLAGWLLGMGRWLAGVGPFSRTGGPYRDPRGERFVKPSEATFLGQLRVADTRVQRAR